MSRVEQIKLFATTLSNLGVGALIAGVVVPTISGTTGDPAHIAAWSVLGVDLIGLALVWLWRLP